MDKIKQSILAVVIGLSLAAGVSLAWTGAPGNPPNPNADAPINVSSNAQAKVGSLSLGTNMPPIVTLNVNGPSNFTGLAQFNNSFRIPVNAGSDKVLTSDSSGLATWQNQSIPKYWVSPSDSGQAEGWFHLGTNNSNRKKTFFHNLGDRSIVYLEGKNANGDIHQMNLGTDGTKGVSWRNKTATSIEIVRATEDNLANPENRWDYIRVIMLKVGN